MFLRFESSACPQSHRPQAVLVPGQGGRALKRDEPQSAETVPSNLTKSQLRKLRKVEELKKKREERASVLEQLQASALTDEQLRMMRPMAQRGQKETKKQK